MLEKFVFVTDSHGDQVDRQAARTVVDWIRQERPAYIIHGGDFLDLRPLRKGASAEEQAEGMVDDVAAGQWFLEELYYRARGKRVLLYGNHDHRLEELANSSTAGIRAEYAYGLQEGLRKLERKLRLETRPYCVRRGIYQVGRLKFLHGYRHNMHVAKSHAEDFGNCIFGHVHRFSQYTRATGSQEAGRSCGCMAKVDMPYLHRSISSLSHQNGFYFGYVNSKSGAYSAWPVPRDMESGQWFFP